MADIDERYKRGMIYTIRNYTDDTMIYVGSTINNLSKRFNKHKENCKAGSSINLYKHIENNDWTDYYIELYEAYPCNNRKELNRREGEVIREIGTINKNIAGRTQKEWYENNVEKMKEYHKEYREENAEKIKEYYKKKYEDNIEKMKEKNKEWYENNIEKKKEINKKWYENNIDKIKEYQNKKVCCNICGAFSTKSNLTKHQKRKICMSKIPDNTDTHTDT